MNVIDRLQQGFMLSATHQLIDKLISETHETLSFSATENTGVQRFLEDAENCKQLLPKLQDSIRCDPHPLEMKLTNVTREIMSSVTKYLEVNFNFKYSSKYILLKGYKIYRERLKRC
jgi:leucine-rich repeat-containing protein 16